MDRLCKLAFPNFELKHFEIQTKSVFSKTKSEHEILIELPKYCSKKIYMWKKKDVRRVKMMAFNKK